MYIVYIYIYPHYFTLAYISIHDYIKPIAKT